MHLVGKKCLQSQHLRGIQRKNLQAFQQLLLGMSGFNRDGPSVCLGLFFWLFILKELVLLKSIITVFQGLAIISGHKYSKIL